MIEDGKVAVSLVQLEKAFTPIYVRVQLLILVICVRFVHPLNALSSIRESLLEVLRSIRMSFVHPLNAPAAIVVTLSGNVTY